MQFETPFQQELMSTNAAFGHQHPGVAPAPTSNRSNKNRLYIGFYHQRHQWDPSVRFRTALLLAPKKPDISSPQSWRYHIRDSFSSQGAIRWEYEGTQVNIVGDDPARRLVALVFLTKLHQEQASGVSLALALRNVEVDPHGGDGGAREWVWNAIRYLVEEGVIPPFPLRAQTIWQNGYQFAQDMEDCQDNKAPTCDIYGRKQKSTVPRG
ncbi:hypothetical protein JAAARDRAFT_58495 [Jaapia argillacea MUCL 33604]|uniref:Uncharacterized protein n=1 Tax=Jaapia argillacea MUCL 33604 TaxID=933084 RepID=A0A067Q352_9AGAM|nr:hypothetical protein JAAARDRAFT_58495 [Jaapia argillacea MUCL 33604]